MIKPTVNDIIRFLTELGLKKNDTVLIHSNIATLGKVENGLDGIVAALLDVIGNKGNLVVPTFSFSFCKGEVFDIQNTKSEVGIFTEYIRNLNSSVRSLHGITSFSAIGNDAKNLMSMSDKTSYGFGSVPANLRKAGCKILQFGTPYISHTHYVEKFVGVPYRFDKYFKGKIKNKSKVVYEAHSLYVRSADRKVVKLVERDPRKEFFKLDLCNEVNFAYGTHRIFYLNDYINFLLPIIDKDPFCLIDQNIYESELSEDYL